jgi:hypothetical protein
MHVLGMSTCSVCPARTVTAVHCSMLAGGGK